MYYFAYASNLSRRQMAERCPGSKPLFKATLPNHDLIFTGWSRQWRGGKASIKPVRDKKVIGGVYQITERDLQSLDRHEGYPREYNRLNKIVFTEDGEPVEVVTYVGTDQARETKPSAEYLAVLKQGYQDWGII
jgi:gamma-glutamylcyclotransferase